MAANSKLCISQIESEIAEHKHAIKVLEGHLEEWRKECATTPVPSAKGIPSNYADPAGSKPTRKKTAHQK